MASILIVYSTTDGQSRKICERLQQLIAQQDHQVEIVSIQQVTGVDLQSFDKVVLGASIRYGKHRPEVYEFIKGQRQFLESRPNAFFTVNLVARKPEKQQPDTNPYLKKFLKQIAWQPQQLAVFAGKLDYPAYSFLDRNVIRLIMWMTKGPTDPQAVVEFTDWNQVEAFAQTVCEM